MYTSWGLANTRAYKSDMMQETSGFPIVHFHLVLSTFHLVPVLSFGTFTWYFHTNVQLIDLIIGSCPDKWNRLPEVSAIFWAGAPCGLSGRFEYGSLSMKTKMKIFSNLHWRMKMWRTQISGLLKNEDYQLPHLLKMKIAFLKLLKTEDLKTSLKNVRKVKTMSCAGSPWAAIKL